MFKIHCQVGVVYTSLNKIAFLQKLARKLGKKIVTALPLFLNSIFPDFLLKKVLYSCFLMLELMLFSRQDNKTPIKIAATKRYYKASLVKNYTFKQNIKLQI